MIRIIDTYPQINSLFENETFNLKKWEEYINTVYPNSVEIFKKDLEEYLISGEYIYEKDILPILNAVNRHPKMDILHKSFCKVTDGLNERIIEHFGKDS